MPGRSWPNTRRGAKELNRVAHKGMTIYTINDMATNLASFEDAQTYNAHTIDGRSSLTGEWKIGHLSISGYLAQYGTAYEQPPAGMRDIATPGRQYGSPLGLGYRGVLDEAEIRGLEKQVAQSSDPKKRRWGR
ncbi:hypothetical protein [Streptomyces sp. NPDC093060]|uniref:hypothetical protein n=1 Tax=Streptomyces sp. NPDC093060 TaxID=3366019 RepID=UPI00380CB249